MKRRISHLHPFQYLQRFSKTLTDRLSGVYNPLNKLVRRIKRVMANWLITWGGMFFPAGLVLLILPLTLKSGIWQAFFLTAFGILFIIFSVWRFAKGLFLLPSIYVSVSLSLTSPCHSEGEKRPKNLAQDRLREESVRFFALLRMTPS